MPVFPAIFEHVVGNLLSVDGSAKTVASNIAGNIARCGCPLRTMCVQYLKILLCSFGEEDFQSFALNYLCSNSFWLLLADNVGGTTIWTNFDYTYPRTICVQYLRILLISFGEDF